MTKDEIKSLINKTIVENNGGEITADKLRSVLLEMVNETPIVLFPQGIPSNLEIYDSYSIPEKYSALYEAYIDGTLDKLVGSFIADSDGNRYNVQSAYVLGNVFDGEILIDLGDIDTFFSLSTGIGISMEIEDDSVGEMMVNYMDMTIIIGGDGQYFFLMPVAL